MHASASMAATYVDSLNPLCSCFWWRGRTHDLASALMCCWHRFQPPVHCCDQWFELACLKHVHRKGQSKEARAVGREAHLDSGHSFVPNENDARRDFFGCVCFRGSSAPLPVFQDPPTPCCKATLKPASLHRVLLQRPRRLSSPSTAGLELNPAWRWKSMPGELQPSAPCRSKKWR